MHEADFDHDHEDLYAHASEMEGVERLTLASVGIDIGSSTTHLLFSRLTLRRAGSRYSTQFSVSEREVLWSSPILLTPYISRTEIDFEQIRQFIEQGYRSAGFAAADIDSGAVVITGEALKKENARPIVEYFARETGKFICASAGPHHEALLAAYGSGAVQLSKATRGRILNVDIGGGTTKLSLIQSGEIIQTAALNIGARLVAFDAAGNVSRLEDAGAVFAEAASMPLTLGAPISIKARKMIGERMADTLCSLLEGGPDMTPLACRLLITAPLKARLEDVDYLVFSGGVSEYIYGRSDQAFGDLGPELGAALKTFTKRLPTGMLMEPSQGIRATVIGASEYTVQVSGATSFFTSTEMLPLHGLKVVRVLHEAGTPFANALRAAFDKFDVEEFGPGLMISLSIDGEVDYATLRDIAQAIAATAKADTASPLIVNVEQDVAHALGHILREEMKVPNPLLAIDGIAVGDLDFVDIGKPINMAAVFPVTVKSLLFSSEPLF